MKTPKDIKIKRPLGLADSVDFLTVYTELIKFYRKYGIQNVEWGDLRRQARRHWKNVRAGVYPSGQHKVRRFIGNIAKKRFPPNAFEAHFFKQNHKRLLS